MNGKEVQNLSVKERKAMGLGYIPSDRHKDAMVPDFSITENFLLGYQEDPKYCKKGFIDYKALEEDAKVQVEQFEIKIAGVSQHIGQLSGGNQQKVILGRETSHDPSFMLVAQPVRGLDIGAIERVHKTLLQLKKEGKAILLISAELSEVMNLGDRIAVLYEGEMSAQFKAGQYTTEEIGLFMAGKKQEDVANEAVANTVSKSIPLAFTGLAVALGSRCGMLNIGAEGQLHAGAMAATLTGLTLSFLPAPILLVVSIAAGIAAGMLVGSVPGIFKAKFQTNEVIVAIMLNYVCTLFTSWLVNGPFKVPGSTAQTEMLPENIWFARLLPKTQLTWALFLLLATAVLMYIFLWKTSVGYQLRAVGANASAAKTAGIPVNFYLIMAMTLSGGIAALAGVTEIFGKYHRFIEGFSPSFGFTGIAVAILGKNHPAGVLLTSLLFGVLEMGSLRMSRETAVSTNMVTVIQSLVILFVAAPELIRWSRKRRG